MQTLKGLIRDRFPRAYRTATWLVHPDRWVAEKRKAERVTALSRTLFEDGRAVVQAGPFAGMEVLRETSWEANYLPRVLGSYEAELHPLLERIVRTGYLRVVDIGCAEGFYAVGLAQRMERAHVYAFDTDSRARRICRRTARINQVEDRVVVEGRLTHRRLGQVIEGRTLIVSDCEGGELELLRPDLVPALLGCDLLVELHDNVNPAISRELSARFARTHAITVVPAADRDPASYPALSRLDPADQEFAVSENRPSGMTWAFMEARASVV